MKLLFDANLSPALAKRLVGEFPDSAHVRDVGLAAASDAEIWNFAKANGFAIVSKDTDFRERSFVDGFPPKVIWLDVGNAGTDAIVSVLHRERQRMNEFEERRDASLLILSLGTAAV